MHPQISAFDPRQKGKLGAHGICPPGRHLHAAVYKSLRLQGIQVFQHMRVNPGKQCPCIEKRLALYRHQIRQAQGLKR